MNLKWLAAASFCLNLALASYFLPKPSRVAMTASAASAPSRERSPVQTLVEQATVTNVAERLATVIAQDWRSVEASDYKQYILNLRSIGCPEETIQDIIIADVNRHFAARMKAAAEPNGVKYWEPWDYNVSYYNRELRIQRDELNRERDAIVRELLGVSLDEEMRKQTIRWMGQDRDDQMLSFLPLAKRQAVQAIVEKERRLTYEAYSLSLMAPNTREPLTPEQEATMARHKTDAKKAIQAVLTPKEYEEYILRISPTANALRYQLASFRPTKEEYDAIYLARYAHDEQVQSRTASSEPPPEVSERIRAALGEERFTEYGRSTDYTYQDLVRFSKQEGLSPDIARTVHDLKRSSEAEATKLRTNPQLSPEERTTAIAALQLRTQKTVEQTLGPETFNRYQPRATWLRRIR